MYKDLIPGVSLEGSVLSLEGEEKQLFLNFARKMLQWLLNTERPPRSFSKIHGWFCNSASECTLTGERTWHLQLTSLRVNHKWEAKAELRYS
jgi:hypothetical protein